MTSTTLTTQQAQVRNADSFRQQLRVLDSSGVGVILCRSREPFRAMEAIRTYAFSRDTGYANWSPIYGWETFDRSNPTSTEPSTDNETSPVKAMEMIGGIGGQATTGGMPVGFYSFYYPHFWLKENVGQRVPLIYAIKEYTRMFSESRRRLVLIAPMGFTLPSEIAEDVVVLDFDVPSYAELSQGLVNLLNTAFAAKTPKIDTEGRERIVSAGMGMSHQEFETAVARAIVTHKEMLPDIPIDNIVTEVMKVKTEVVKRSEVLEVMPPANMSEVGGLEELKSWVSKRARCFSQEAKDFGIDAPKGVGMFGPPGTGKSLTAKAISSTLGLPLIKFDVSRIFQSLVGQSEERVRAALKMLDAMAPCVAFLDEIDKAFQRSSGGDSGVSQRVLGAILTHMQESDAPIFWVFSANRVDNLPPELLRKGRLDEIFAVSTPDATERLAILQIHLRKRKQTPENVTGLDKAVNASEGYVPAEIEAAVKEALVEAFTMGTTVSGDLIAAQLGNMKPLSEAFAEDFHAMQTWAENNARPASASIKKRARPASTPRARPASGGPRQVQVGG